MSELDPIQVARFERQDGSWREVLLDGLKVTQIEGFVDAQTKLNQVSSRRAHRHPTPAAALKWFRELNTARGWPPSVVLQRARAPAKWVGLQPGSVNAELEAALDGADDRSFGAAARVYTDWLLGEGDPRGELAAHLQTNADAFLADHAEVFFGELDVFIGHEITGLEWHGGLLRAATLRGRVDTMQETLTRMMEQFLELPVARFVNRLRVGLAHWDPDDHDWGPTFEAIRRSPRAPFLRELRFEEENDDTRETRGATLGELSGWSAFRRLESLVVYGANGSLGELELPSLEHFVRASTALTAGEFESIARAQWPRLERLTIEFGTRAEGSTVTREHLGSLFANPLPRLRQLALTQCEFTDEVISQLAAHPLLELLDMLDLSNGSLSDQHVELLLRSSSRLRRLGLLKLDKNALSEAAVAELTAALPNLSTWHQRR
ncbi:MAG: hypothetical protein QM817_06015 [Archangium sp.]